MTFDSKLNAYIISENELKYYSTDQLNRLNNKILLDVSSTKELSVEMLSKITNSKIRIRVRGGYDKNRADYWSRLNQENPNVREGKYGIRGLSYYEDSNIYSVGELTKIIKEIEKIEKGILPEWSPIKKALYVYDRLREEIIYHPKYENETSYEIRTLRGLLSKKTVCAGYAMIFKEIMDRLGIECHYVEGCTTKAGHEKDITNHAWNLLKIDGNFYPIDLTWDATRYRQGQTDSFDFFSNLQLFRKTHFPSSIEKIKDYRVLSGIRSDFVRKTIKQFKRKKDYSTSIIPITSKNKEEIKLVQTGIVEDKEIPLYRYVMATKDKDGTFKNYRIMYSEANFLKVYNDYLKGKHTDKSPAIIAHLDLFSYENVDRFLRDGTTYIGQVVSDKSNPKGYRFKYDESKKGSRSISYREEKRANGEHILINESMVDVIRGQELHFGSVSSFSDNGFRSYKVVSDKSLRKDSSYGYINGFLSEGRLARKVSESGGYLGSYNNGAISYDSNLSNYFSIRRPGELTKDDIVPPTSVANEEKVQKMKLSDVEKYFYKYSFKYDYKRQDYVVIERKTKKECTDPRTKTIAIFAGTWFAAAGVSWTSFEDQGKTYAFNEGAASIFDYLTSTCVKSLEETGKIDFNQLSGDDMERRGYSKYKHSYEIISNFTRNPYFRERLFNFCNLQTECYYSQAIKESAQNYNNSSVNSELSDMFGDENSSELSETDKKIGKKN